MREAARAEAAIEVLARIEADIAAGAPAADRRLTEWARGARYAGSKDRRAVGDLVYQALRRRGSYLAATEAEALSAAARARMLVGAATLETAGAAALDPLFSGETHAPAALDADERRRLARAGDLLADATMIAHDFPETFRADLERSVADPLAEIGRLRERAAADMRANRLKTTRADALARLAEEGVEAAPGLLAPTAIRLARPAPMGNLGAYRDGWIEPQDAASQATALLAEAAPGETALDYCAGGGGKTLALAAEMARRPDAGGRLAAFDVNARRMVDLPARAARAGARIDILNAADLENRRDGFDLVFVDAPCSGSGAWARNPDAKWSARPSIRESQAAAQRAALANAAAFVRPGGRLVYVTCSLFFWENTAQTAAFLEARSDFEPNDLAAAWRRADLEGAPPAGPSSGAGQALIPPSAFGTDGFFVALFKRSGGVY